MKKLNYLAQGIYVANSKNKGRGVFSSAPMKKNTIIEIAPVIVMSASDRGFIDQTLLHDYIFEWGHKQHECCMALGYVPLYNHSYEANCEYEMDFRSSLITVTTTRAIEAGEELFINYNGDANSKKPLWFNANPS